MDQGFAEGDLETLAENDEFAALSGPLDFAVRDDFAGLARVEGLAETLRLGCQRARALCIPADLLEALERVEAALATPPQGAEAWRSFLGELRARVLAWSREDFEAESGGPHQERGGEDPPGNVG